MFAMKWSENNILVLSLALAQFMTSVFRHYPKLEPKFLTAAIDLKLWYSIFLYSLAALFLSQINIKWKRNYIILSLLLVQYTSMYYDIKYQFVLDLVVLGMITISMMETFTSSQESQKGKVYVKVD